MVFEVPFPSAGVGGIESQAKTLLALTHGLAGPLAIPAVPLDHHAGDDQQQQEAAAAQPQDPSHSHILSFGRPSPLRQQQPVLFFHGTQHGAAFVHNPLAVAGANHGESSVHALLPAQRHGFLELGKPRLHEPVNGVQSRLLGRIDGGQLSQSLPDGLLLSKSGLEGLTVALIAGKQVAALPCLGVLEVRHQRPDRIKNLV